MFEFKEKGSSVKFSIAELKCLAL